jgi:putative ABC transport system ATP-binding protein
VLEDRVLKLENVALTLQGHSLFHNLSCTIQDEDFISIVGTNGAGKTTLFDIIAGKIIPDKGTIILNDTDITYDNERKRAAFIARLHQNPYLNCAPSLTVQQNIALALYKNRYVNFSSGMSVIDNNYITQCMDECKINYKKISSMRMGELSGGQRQLISFIMATLVRPQLLLLDEPTAALDPTSATHLLTFAIKYIKSHNITTLLITHDPYIARSVGNKLWVLHHGTISKEFVGKEKAFVEPSSLIGQVDYTTLSNLNNQNVST